MKISLITVCYNSRPYIENALASVAGQSHPQLEYIVIDGASTDGTLELLQRYRAHIHLLVSEPDQGMYHAINKGLQLATGEVVGLLHADDVLESPHTLANIAQAFAQQQADAVYGDLRYVRQDNLNQQLRYWRAGSFGPRSLAYGWMPPHPTLYVRRSLALANGPYDTHLRIAADYEWMLRLLRHPIRLHYLPQVLVRMRVGGASNKSLGNIRQKMRDDLQALHKNQIGSWLTLVLKNLRKLGQLAHAGSVIQHFTTNL